MSKRSLEKELDCRGTITYACQGTSMLPLLRQQKDLFTISKQLGRCKKFDVVLYKRKDGAYVLHRIVKVRKESYVILGDNCIYKEYGITDDDIMGVMVRFIRNGREYSVDSKIYRGYVAIWHTLYPLRKLFRQIEYRIRVMIS